MQTIEIKLEIDDLPSSKQPEFLSTLSAFFKDALSVDMEFTDLTLNEEEQVTTQISLRAEMRKALEQISGEPLWGETDNIDIEAAKAAGEWQDGSYFPSSITESERLARVVNLARETLRQLDYDFGILKPETKVYAVANSPQSSKKKEPIPRALDPQELLFE